MRCNVAIRNEGKFKKCNLDLNHICNHNYEIIQISHVRLKEATIGILAQIGLWGGFMLSLFVGKILWDSVSASLMAVMIGIFTFFGALLGIVFIAEELEKYWKLNIYHKGDLK